MVLKKTPGYDLIASPYHMQKWFHGPIPREVGERVVPSHVRRAAAVRVAAA